MVILSTEQAHHLHGHFVLLRLQKAAVDEYGHGGLVLRRGCFQRFEKVQQSDGEPVRIQGEHKQHVGSPGELGT